MCIRDRSLPQGTSSPIGGLGSYFLLDGELDITSDKDIVMIGNVGGNSNKSRAETYAVMDDLLSFASSINIRDSSTDADIAELIEASSIAEFMELHPRDVRALVKLINDNLPLIISTHRASDILKLIELKEKYNLNLIIKGAQDASLVASQIAESNTPLIICLLYTSPSPRDRTRSRMPSSA